MLTYLRERFFEILPWNEMRRYPPAIQERQRSIEAEHAGKRQILEALGHTLRGPSRREQSDVA